MHWLLKHTGCLLLPVCLGRHGLIWQPGMLPWLPEHSGLPSLLHLTNTLINNYLSLCCNHRTNIPVDSCLATYRIPLPRTTLPAIPAFYTPPYGSAHLYCHVPHTYRHSATMPLPGRTSLHHSPATTASVLPAYTFWTTHVDDTFSQFLSCSVLPTLDTGSSTFLPVRGRHTLLQHARIVNTSSVV